MDLFYGRDQKLKGCLETSLSQNVSFLEKAFSQCNDMVKKEFLAGTEKNLQVYLIYTDGLTKTDMIEESILRPLLNKEILNRKGEELYQYVYKEVLEMADLKEVTDFEEVVTQVLSGNTILLLDTCPKGILISSKMFPSRGVQTADQEASMRGSKDSFTESLRSNTALIRRRIRDSRLKAEQLTVGERSKTDVVLMYMEDLVKEG